MARTFRRPRTMQPIAELNVTNMIDLGFTLLIIFMIASTVIQQEQNLPVDLPTTSSTNQKLDPEIKYETVTVKADGTFMLGDKVLTIGSLGREFTRMAGLEKRPVIQIAGDIKSNYGAVMKVIDEAGKHGLTQLSFLTKPRELTTDRPVTSRYPQAVVLSATMHVVFVGLILLATYIAGRNFHQPRMHFELVAGPGDNFEAKQAPAIGNPNSLNVPNIPVSPPITQAPAETQPTPTPRAIQPPAPRVTPTPVPTPAPPQKKQISISESKADVTKAGAKQPTAPKTTSVKVPKIDAEGIAKGVIGGSTSNKTGGAGGKALTASEAAGLMDPYYAYFKSVLIEKIESHPGLSDRLTAELEVRIAADGTLSSPRIKKSSGNAEFDRAILEAVRQIKLRNRPDNKSDLAVMRINLRDASAQ